MELGLDRLGTTAPLCRRLEKDGGRRVGVLAHAASVDRGLVHIGERLDALGVRPRVWFAPEHGFGGAAQDMATIDDEVLGTGTRVVSLYGDTLEALVPGARDLAGLDLLLIDLADVGARYYTFVWPALLAARSAARAGVHTVLLDRPNPRGGGARQVEGASQRPGFTSFVGWEPVPVRHALTLAELVCLFAGDDGLALGPRGAVSAVTVAGWDRESLARSWDRPFVQPSPNMPTADTALVYPGGCLLEGTNLSEGRGHTRPFEVVGAPFFDGDRLARELAATGLRGFVARPVTFVPTFHKHAGKACGGVQIHPTDEATFRPYATYLALVALAHAQAPEQFRFRTERYEFVDDVPAFDLLTGSAVAREAILGGASARDVAELVAAPDRAWPARMELARARASAAAW